MKKLPVILASVSLLAASIAPVFAEDTMTTEVVTPTTAATTTTTTLKRTALRQVVQPTVQAMRAEAVTTMKETISKAKEAFKTKLAAIKDEQKKTVVENIDNRITTVNQNRTSEMTQVLTTLSDILDRVSSKSATAKEAGKDTTTVEKDITSARSAISAAQTAVAAQQAKEYTINITTEAKLRTSVMTTLALFRKDIQAVYKEVVTARDGVRVAALDDAKLNSEGVDVTTTPEPTASDSANQ